MTTLIHLQLGGGDDNKETLMLKIGCKYSIERERQ